MASRLLRRIFSRKFLVSLLLILQAFFLIVLIWHYSTLDRVISEALTFISILVCLYIVSRRDKTAFKLSWCVFILVFPLVGGVLYLLFRIQSSVSYLTRKYGAGISKQLSRFPQNPVPEQDLLSRDSAWHKQVHYLQTNGFPLYYDTDTAYFPSGEAAFAALTERLRQAHSFIFLEFFIIDEGLMWDTLYGILCQKALEGVEIRIIYDDLGCLWTLPKDFAASLREYGIKFVPFNAFRPFWTTLQNNRDHRKIVVIDGEYAMTGGFNVADEYINTRRRFGYWKDAAVMLHGDGVASFTEMFLQMWHAASKSGDSPFHYESDAVFYPTLPQSEHPSGFLQPYGSNPTVSEHIGEYVYLQTIHRARRYLYIQTPYLIIADSMMSALKLAARSGVDVRIMTPGIPDKKFVFLTTRAHYLELLEAGVRIYEYTPGFLHAKITVSDDEVATVGTANFDFRSLYLHFECGVRFYQSSVISEIRDDVLASMKVSREVTVQECRSRPFPVRVMQNIAKLVAPLL